jgi:hypothetical protein
VIGCGVKSSTSDLLIASCDEFIYYDDLVRAATKTPAPTAQKRGKAQTKHEEAMARLAEITRSLELDYDTVWGSQLKQAIRRVYPGFNEDYYGYGSFTEMLEDAKAEGLLRIEYDEERGNFKVRSTRS